MPLTNPTSQTWTLRLKSSRTTVLLHVSPTHSWTAIKTELLHALRLTNPDGLLNGNTIPDSPEDVLLAKAIDANKLELGWTSLEPEDQDDNDEDMFGEDEEEPQGKGKGKAKAGRPKAGAFKECPQGAGLRDGAAVAFKFRGAKTQSSTAATGLGLDEGFVDDEDNENSLQQTPRRPGGASSEWDVVLPQYEDVYGLGELEPDDELATPKPNKFADFGGA